MGSIGPTELIIIGVVLVLLFGATRLPATAQGLGKALKMFKKEIRDEDKPAEGQDSAQSNSSTPQSVTTPPQAISSTTSQPAAEQHRVEEPKRTES